MLAKIKVELVAIFSSYLADINILYFAESTLQAATARSIHTIAQTVHSLDEEGQPTRVGRWLATQECLFGHGGGDLACDEVVCLAAEFFHNLVSRRRVEDVEFNRHILIIKLLDKTQARDISHPVAEAGIPELVRRSLSKY